MSLDPKEFEQFMTLARVKLTGASDAGLRLELYDVLKEFFSDSHCWREDIEFQAKANTSEYLLSPSEDGQIVSLIGTWDDKGIPVPAFMADFGTIKLLHAPEFDPPAKWFSRVVKTVTLPTTSENVPVAPRWTLQVYSVHILDGLLGRMMGQPAKSYSNATMSVYHLRRFRQGIKIARVAADQANLKGAQSWAFPRFAQGSQRGGVSTAWPTRAF